MGGASAGRTITKKAIKINLNKSANSTNVIENSMGE
jgi:hypothetical protein